MVGSVPEADHYTYDAGERRPVEVLVFAMAPEHVDEFVRIDHEIWTLGEAFVDGTQRIPFLSKEVLLDDRRPGEVTIVFVWESLAMWQHVGETSTQKRLQASFDAAFTHPYTLVRGPDDEANAGVHRITRFERT